MAETVEALAEPERRALVLAANEVFHNLEGEEYAAAHPEIFRREGARWRRLLRRFIRSGSGPRTYLDIGSGTGFVGQQLGEVLRSGDSVICADIASRMLEIATRTLSSRYPDVRISALKLESESLPMADRSVDIVTMNSVLHHVPDTNVFLQEVMRVLKPGGLLFIGHEPNTRFAASGWLPRQAIILHRIHPVRLLAKCLRRGTPAQNSCTAKGQSLLDRANAELHARGLIRQPLTWTEFSRLVDDHSPTAGGWRPEEGFDPWNLVHTRANALRLLHVETYNHLGKLHASSRMFSVYDRLLRHFVPRSGSSFFLVAERSRG